MHMTYADEKEEGEILDTFAPESEEGDEAEKEDDFYPEEETF